MAFPSSASAVSVRAIWRCARVGSGVAIPLGAVVLGGKGLPVDA